MTDTKTGTIAASNDNQNNEEKKLVANGESFAETETNFDVMEGGDLSTSPIDTEIDSKILDSKVANNNTASQEPKNEELTDSAGQSEYSETIHVDEMDKLQKSAETSLAKAKEFLPKEEFDLKYKKAFAEALKFLEYELSLAPILNGINTTHRGFRSDLKNSTENQRTKKEILWQDYGLKEKTAWEIQQLTPELIKKIVAKAVHEQRLPTRGMGIAILKKEADIHNAEEKAEEIAAKKDEKFQQKLAHDHEKLLAQNSQESCVLDGQKFNVIYADPDETKMSINDVYNLNLPIADDAILFWWIKPGQLFETVETIKHWGFQYSGEAVWNLDDQVVWSGSCFNQTDRLLLVATKGENPPRIDNDDRKKKSVFMSRPDFDLVEKPAYYLESIERMFPAGAFLNLFSTNSTNPKWTLMMQEKKEDEDVSNND